MMKILYTILLMPLSGYSTNYYFSNSGSDVANGTSSVTPFQTIAKHNSLTFSAGDSIFFKKGDSWNEQLIPPSSGSSGNIIYYGSYGSGANPVISGFQTLTGWTNDGNIWSSTFSNSVRYQNTITVNGTLRAKGRYPNYGVLTYTSHSGNNQITGSLTGTPNYTGGEVAVRTNWYTIDKSYTTSQSGGTINYSPSSYYQPNNNFGYTIQNIPSVLDTLNEWCYDTTTKVIKVYHTSQPTVQASSIDTLVYIRNKSYITITGLSFTGANIETILVDSSNNISVTNCSISNGGMNGVTATLSPFLVVTGNLFDDLWNTGIATENSNDGNLNGNTMNRIGTKWGMGKSQWKGQFGIYSFGKRVNILNNVIDSIGYIGIATYGDTGIVKYNVVSHTQFVKHDGGGIYTWGAQPQYGLSNTGTKMIGNIVSYSVGALEGDGIGGIPQAYGIYADDGSDQVTIDSNTVFSNAYAGIYIHHATNMNVRRNKIFNNKSGIKVYRGYQLNIDFKGNQIFTNIYQYNTYPFDFIQGYADSYAAFGASDSNYFYRTSFDSTLFGYNSSQYSLYGWQQASGKDIHSYGKPSGVTSADAILKTNSNLTAQTQFLSGTYYDMTGVVYNNSITLQPFQSAILFKATTDLPPDPNYTPVRKLKFKKIRIL